MNDLLSFLKRAKPDWQSESIHIKKLFGQASARQYFRIEYPNETSLIIMKIPGGFSSPAEEITKVEAKAPTEFAFINVARYLKSLDLPVPAVYFYEADLGLVLLQDLGNESLENLILKSNAELVTFYYKQVLDLLLKVQRQTKNNPSVDCVAYYKKFDEDLLNWEWDHFLEFGIEDRFQCKVLPEDKDVFYKVTRELTQKITQMPQGFVHRDFQSRNIQFHEMNFFMIDFQDALLGPVVYDLVALLRDSYIDLAPQTVEELLAYFTQKAEPDHPYYQNLPHLLEDFYTLTLQRKLKDAGRFQYIHTVRGNPNFLVHWPLTLQFIKHALTQVPKAKPLEAMLQKYVAELK